MPIGEFSDFEFGGDGLLNPGQFVLRLKSVEEIARKESKAHYRKNIRTPPSRNHSVVPRVILTLPMREKFSTQKHVSKLEETFDFPRVFDEKSLGIIAAKPFLGNGLTEKVNSLEFAHCLPKEQPN